MDELEWATAAFCRGLAGSRSLQFPSRVRELPGEPRLQVIEDGERQKGDYRMSEYVAVVPDPAEMRRRSQEDGERRPGRFAVSAIYPGAGPFRRQEMEFRQEGYRLLRREPFFVRTEPAREGGSPDVRPVRTEEDLELFLRLAGLRNVDRAAMLSDEGRYRAFVAVRDGCAVGRVSSVHAGGGCAWVSSLFVEPEYRRQGLGAALMRAMLRDDHARGYARSVLLATRAGARLYPQLGYRQIGTLLLHMEGRGEPA